MITSFALVIVLCVDSCKVCSLVARDVKLCAAHAEEERSAFAREGKRLESADEAERIAALESLAALTASHENAPSERVAVRIASALADKSYAIRKQAAELLGRPQHALASLAALEKALSEAERDLKRSNKEREELSRELRKEKLTQTQRQDILGRIGNNEDVHMVIADWRMAVVLQLAEFQDDRVVTAICAHTPRDLLGAGKVLARLGTSKAMKAVVESVQSCELTVAEARAGVESRRKLLASAPDALRPFEEELKRLEDEVAAFQSELVAILSERGVQAPIPPNNSFESWRKWLEQKRDAFPEHLPGVSSPAWE